MRKKWKINGPERNADKYLVQPKNTQDCILKFLKLFWVLKFHWKPVLSAKLDSSKIVMHSAMWYVFWWAHPTALQWCASAKGFLWLGENILVHTQTEVQLIFMSLKSPTHSIVYPVLSTLIQKLSYRHLHLKFLARVYQSQITCQYLWNLYHRRAFLWGTVDFNLGAEQKNRWSKEGTHQMLWIPIAAWAPHPQRRPKSETSAY